MHGDTTFKHQRATILMTPIAILLAGALLAGCGGLESGGPKVTSVGANVGVFPPSAQPFGKSYGEWSAAWWKWAYEIPLRDNPQNDLTGEKCHIGQSGPVWFLAGTGGPPTAERTCTIPAGKGIFFPIVNLAGFIPFDAETPEQLRAIVIDIIDRVTELEASVDGVALQGLLNYRFQSPSTFFFTGPPEPDTWAPGSSGTHEAFSDGYWIMLEPLPAGPHTIRFHGRFTLAATFPNVNEFTTTVTYHLTAE